jgi:threonine dehydrogenase-like Zn-dependent dehydrogenase
MSKIFEVPLYPYQRSADQDSATPVRHPVVVVGAGPVGLALAIDLAMQDVAVVVLDENDKVSVGLARDLLRQAAAGNPRPARLRRSDGRQGRGLESRQGLF